MRYAFFIGFCFALDASALCELELGDKAKAIKLSSKKLLAIDGDSLRFGSEQLRLIGVNTPEYQEPLSRKAKKTVSDLIKSSSDLYWLKGEQEKDRYGRYLSHLFLSDGRNIAALLLDDGLGFAVAIPPNLSYSSCVFSVEAGARKADKGVWANQYFQPVEAAFVPDGMAGFKRIRGKLKSFNRSAKNWWLELEGDVVLKVSKKDQPYFDEKALMLLLHKEIEVSGWVVDRRQGRNKGRSRYSRYMLLLRHPLHLRVLKKS